MSLNFDLFWSFRSPYSYLLLPRVVDLVTSHDVTCTVRIVYPIAVRQADFFQKVDPLWVFYLMKDTYREAEFLGMPYRWPKPDPVTMDPATRLYPPEQPHIHRLSQLARQRLVGALGAHQCAQLDAVLGAFEARGDGRLAAAGFAQARLQLFDVQFIGAHRIVQNADFGLKLHRHVGCLLLFDQSSAGKIFTI